MQPRFAEHVDREGVRTEQAREGGHRTRLRPPA